MEKNSYTVQIGANNFVLKTTRTKEETDKIVSYVDKMIELAKEAINYRNPTMHATFACINIADELYSMKKDFEELKKISDLPMKEYEPLKEKLEKYKEDSQDVENAKKELNYKISQLQNELKIKTLDRDRFKLELDRQVKSVEQYKLEIEDLRNKLMEQEKQTLIAKKQLQEKVRIESKKI